FFANIEPVPTLAPLNLGDRGAVKKQLAKAVVAALPGDIAKRELAQIEKKLGWTEDQLQVRQLPQEWGPGNILTLEIESENVTEVFTSFGMKGVSAEAVEEQAFREARRYLACDAPVGPHLADQLLLPIAMAGGGSFVTYEPTEHTRTNIQVIQRFLPVRFEIIERKQEVCEIRVEP